MSAPLTALCCSVKSAPHTHSPAPATWALWSGHGAGAGAGVEVQATSVPLLSTAVHADVHSSQAPPGVPRTAFATSQGSSAQASSSPPAARSVCGACASSQVQFVEKSAPVHAYSEKGKAQEVLPGGAAQA
jgi:hypothetical protein